MDRERWEKVQDLLMDALQKDPEYREAFVRAACGGNNELAEEVIALLNADPSAGLLDQPPLASVDDKVDPRVGTTVLHYKILSRLDDGGMGVVYKARDTKLQRLVALKFLLPHLARDEDARDRFMREARTASALDHPNICTIYEIGETEDGQTYISMPFYEGQTLAEKITEGPLPVGEALSIAIQAADGLERAHEVGIIHRDIKPANLFVTHRGRVKILDFGIAKMTGAAVTRTGGTFGTLLYMSPQQIQGEEIDSRSDIWSLGAVLYEMLTGERPFRGDYESAIIYSILHETPRPPRERNPEVTESLENIVARSLARDLEDRYENAERLKADLESVLAGQTPDVAPVPEHRKRSKATAAGFGIAAIVALAAVFFLGQRVEISPATSGTGVSENLIAVLPFQVSGSEESQWLGDGISTQLSMALSGFGVADAVDPNAISGRLVGFEGVLDPAKGTDIARHFRAGKFVLGNVIEIGDNLRVSASVYTNAGVLESRFDVANMPREDLAKIVDTLALQIIGDATGQEMDGLLEAGVVSTRSTDALREFVRGEEATRTSFEGREHFKRAVEIDSNFAAAWFRVMELYCPRTPDGRALCEKAKESFNRTKNRLPERERSAGEARLASYELDHQERMERYRELVNRWPQYGRGWYWLGDELYHGGYFFGSPSGDAFPHFEKALRYDVGSGEIALHTVEWAARNRDFDTLDSLWAGHENLRLNKVPAEILLALGRKDEERFRELTPKLDVLSSREASYLGWFLAFSHMIPESRRIYETIDARPELDVESRRWVGFMLGLLDLTEGKLALADSTFIAMFEVMPTVLQFLVVSRFMDQRPLEPNSLERLRTLATNWDTTTVKMTQAWSGQEQYAGRYTEFKAYLEGLLAHLAHDQRGFDTARAAVRRVAQRKGKDAIAYGYSRSLDALEHRRKGQFEQALVALNDARRPYDDHPSMTVIDEQILNRYIQAEMLFSEGRYEEALKWYRTVLEPGWILPWGIQFLGSIYYRYGQIYEEMGDYEQSVKYYGLFVELWKDADPELRHLVEDAKARLEIVFEKQVREPAP